MPILLSAKNVKKSYGVRALFEGLTFVVEEGERIGLIGPNGAGKSTLLRIMAGEIAPDSGELAFRKGLRTGFLTQTPQLDGQLTVEEAIRQGVAHHADEEATTGEVLSRLELNTIAHRKVGTLSGGWKKRVALARELVRAPELLLLDEPTNHLDVESILWLENFIAKSAVTTVTVTHDRVFLQRVSNRIVELDFRNPNGLLSVAGDYSTYLERKEQLLAAQERQETVLRNTLRREVEWLRRGPKARTTKQQARIKSAYELMDQVEAISERNQQESARIDFVSTDKKPKRLIEAKKIKKAMGDRLLFQDLDLFIGPGSRVGLLGQNGCGKSTLIRILIGESEPDSGSVLRSDHLKVAYFEQNRELLDPSKTLRKTLCPDGDQVNYRGRLVHIHGYLDRFLFRKEQVDMQVGRLSGGEQSRVLLARLMLQEANVLVLDEPTNDLDVETLNVLQDCLIEFDGAVLLVTHDRYFLDQVATQICAFPPLEMPTGEVITFSSLEQWEQWRKEKLQSKKMAEKTAVPSATSKKRKLSYNEARELKEMETKILTVETKLAGLEAEAQLPQNQSNASRLSEIYQSISQTQQEIEHLYARWGELEALNQETKE